MKEKTICFTGHRKIRKADKCPYRPMRYGKTRDGVGYDGCKPVLFYASGGKPSAAAMSSATEPAFLISFAIFFSRG